MLLRQRSHLDKIMGRTSVTYDPDALTTAVTVNQKVESAQPIGAINFTQPSAGDTTAPDPANNINVFALINTVTSSQQVCSVMVPMIALHQPWQPLILLV